MTSMTCWYFAPDDLRLRYHHDTPYREDVPRIAEGVVHDFADFRGCRYATDALRYAYGHKACLVKLEGDLRDVGNGSVLGRSRTYLRVIDATEILTEFMYWCAKGVAHHCKSTPEVLRYLETRDPDLRYLALNSAMSKSDELGGQETGFAADAVALAIQGPNLFSPLYEVVQGVQWRSVYAATCAATEYVEGTSQWDIAYKKQTETFNDVLQGMLLEAMSISGQEWNQITASDPSGDIVVEEGW